MLSASTSRGDVRPAAVAGSFYPRDPAALLRAVDAALAEAQPASPPPPKALIVPHAGYVYSGRIAASAYSALASARMAIHRVVLLGPCHRVPVRGLALPDADGFETPLGVVRVDREAARSIADLPQVVRSAAAHADEHALEVQLPFLQRVLGTFSILPLAVGSATPREVGEVLDRLWGGPETLIVVSSDLSHYHRYDDARRIDAATARAILALDAELDHEQACGATPIAGLLTVAKRRGLVPQLIALENSGDTAGDKARVVGYAAFAFREPASGLDELTDEHGRTLLGIARSAIRTAVGGTTIPPAGGAWLDEHRACFVTLRCEGTLRGCIGSIVPRRSLRDDVAANAHAAAFADPRFPPLVPSQLDVVRLEVSVLSIPARMHFRDRDELIAKLEPLVDGLVLRDGPRSATFLPQVWEMLPDPADFLDALVRKAGLAPGTALEACKLERYRVRKWTEDDACATTPAAAVAGAPQSGLLDPSHWRDPAA